MSDRRSCFIQYPNANDALSALRKLMVESPVPFTVAGIFCMRPGTFPNTAGNPVEVYFVLDVSDFLDGVDENRFIAASGGEHTGS